jgi:membrane fusion protein (multidrug efflux system)
VVRNRPSILGCTIVSGLILAAACVSAMAQQGAPPPAVTVAPVASREVTDTAEFVGRVVAINKVDIVARVPGFIEERTFTEGQ